MFTPEKPINRRTLTEKEIKLTEDIIQIKLLELRRRFPSNYDNYQAIFWSFNEAKKAWTDYENEKDFGEIGYHYANYIAEIIAWESFTVETIRRKMKLEEYQPIPNDNDMKVLHDKMVSQLHGILGEMEKYYTPEIPDFLRRK
jgi:hypothetical protein